ncbi:uncharacterized protein LOC127002573 [Eriocheir sinensis]|uniref:uncharacterized protein LOC127002573 n=1 Tax=Eriocheir sinensis TaxID=95602 RepID=UPI0021CA6B5A|nr:uncharacterized protein LOC127002573 [Eriocheir sinensis]
MRTRYGRLSEASKKSGRGAASSLSVRDQWILRTFSFLHSHIVRCPSRQTAKFSQRSPSPSHVSYNVDGEVMSEGGGEAEDTDDPASHNADIGAGPSGEASTSMASSHTSKGKRRKVVGEETHELLAKLLSRADEVTDLKQRVRDLTQSTDPFHKKIDAWVSYFAAELHDFKPQVWNRFVSAATQLLHKYKQENDALDLGPPAATTEVQPSSHPPKVATATTTAVSLPPCFFNTSGANLNTSGIATPPHDANFMNPTPPIRTSTPRPTSQNQEY